MKVITSYIENYNQLTFQDMNLIKLVKNAKEGMLEI